MDRIDLYLQENVPEYYVNTREENERVNKFDTLYQRAKAWKESQKELNPVTLDYYRRAYKGELNALNITTGKESDRKSRQLRKLVYEMIESKIDNSVPLPKMVPRYKGDKGLVDVTESFMKTELNTLLAKYTNDAAERATYVDGTTWYKVCWDPMDSSVSHSGSPRIEVYTVDQITPQPQIKNYKDLEYIFELKEMSLTRIYDLYGRVIVPLTDDCTTVPVISCYYLNEDHIVGLFSYARHTLQVICDEHDWQIRKIRKCTRCGAINPVQDECGNCGGKHFKYETADKEVLADDLVEIKDPYEVQEEREMNGQFGEQSGQGQNLVDAMGQQAQPQVKLFASKGTEIPFYRIRQLPFVPRPAVSQIDSIYGVSEVKMILDEQDATNKMLTKAVDKGLKSGTILTKPEKVKLGDTDNTVKVLSVRTAEEAAMIQSKQAVSDVTQDVVLANLIYENARNTTGITQSYQGQNDSSATSGKAKQVQVAQTSGRIESLRVMKAAAFAGVYELVLKYLLAFSDEPYKFVKVLPNGEETELVWNKYMFLARDKYGSFYYRDDFTFNTDPAATLSQDRVLMWQETQDKFINGALGSLTDPRTVELFWNIMSMFEYPLAKIALAGIKANSKHLPPEIEQALMNNPELLQAVMTSLQEGEDQRGGARPNSGPSGNGGTHSVNVERTNERNRSQNRETAVSAQQASTAGGEG